MKLPTVTLKNPITGKIRKINRFDYQRNPSKWNKWLVVSMSDIGVTQAAVDHTIAEMDAEQKRLEKPGHISRGDKQRAYEGRIIKVTGATAEAIAKQARRA